MHLPPPLLPPHVPPTPNSITPPPFLRTQWFPHILTLCPYPPLYTLPISYYLSSPPPYPLPRPGRPVMMPVGIINCCTLTGWRIYIPLWRILIRNRGLDYRNPLSPWCRNISGHALMGRPANILETIVLVKCSHVLVCFVDKRRWMILYGCYSLIYVIRRLCSLDILFTRNWTLFNVWFHVRT